MEHRLDRLVVRRTRPGRRRLGWLAVAVAADALGLGYGVHALYVRLSDHHATTEPHCPSFVLSGDVLLDRRTVRRWLRSRAQRPQVL
jgi:hypothetical protein